MPKYRALLEYVFEDNGVDEKLIEEEFKEDDQLMHEVINTFSYAPIKITVRKE